jgi:hypothetical protein
MGVHPRGERSGSSGLDSVPVVSVDLTVGAFSSTHRKSASSLFGASLSTFMPCV